MVAGSRRFVSLNILPAFEHAPTIRHFPYAGFDISALPNTTLRDADEEYPQTGIIFPTLCREFSQAYLALPRGCLEDVLSLLGKLGIAREFQDERVQGKVIDVSFQGTLRADQEAAISAMLRHDAGVLCAPTAFGKTVTAAGDVSR